MQSRFCERSESSSAAFQDLILLVFVPTRICIFTRLYYFLALIVRIHTSTMITRPDTKAPNLSPPTPPKTAPLQSATTNVLAFNSLAIIPEAVSLRSRKIDRGVLATDVGNKSHGVSNDVVIRDRALQLGRAWFAKIARFDWRMWIRRLGIRRLWNRTRRRSPSHEFVHAYSQRLGWFRLGSLRNSVCSGTHASSIFR